MKHALAGELNGKTSDCLAWPYVVCLYIYLYTSAVRSYAGEYTEFYRLVLKGKFLSVIKETAADLGATDTSWVTHTTSVVNWRVKRALTRELNGNLHISMHGHM